MYRIYVCAEGSCWKRQLDASKIEKYLINNGYHVVKTPSEANFIIFISCAFLNNREKNSIKLIKKFQKFDGELIVGGCLPTVGKERLEKIFKGRTLPTKEIHRIEEIFPPKKGIRFQEMDDANIVWGDSHRKYIFEKNRKMNQGMVKLATPFLVIGKNIIKKLLNPREYRLYKFLLGEHFHVRISWGCNWNCSYCTIKKSTGPHRSKPLRKCLKEIERGLKLGYKYFVIDGADIGAYGRDIGSSFPELLDRLTSYAGDYKIIIREFHPYWLIVYLNELRKILRKNKILIFDIALQSASKRILKLMNRPYNVDKIEDAILTLRDASPDVIYTCELMIGFPTETIQDIQSSLDFVKKVDFTGGQIYLTSIRPGTEAEKIEPKISREEIIRRVNYSKKFLKKAGYNVKFIPKEEILLFSKLSKLLFR